MNTLLRRLFRPAGRAPIALLGLLFLFTAASLAGCGDDESTSTDPAAVTSAQPSSPSGGDAVTSTDVEPGGGAGIPDLPANDDPSAVQCTGPPEEVFDATAIVGEPVGEATRQAREAGCNLRVVVEDGKPLAVTDDFRPDRIDVVVGDGVVEKIDGLY